MYNVSPENFGNLSDICQKSVRTRGQWPCCASGQAVDRGCGGVEAMEVKSDFEFELTDLNYLCSHITCHYSQDHCYDCLSKMASEVTDDLRGH